jgi:hypothetical protein
MTYKGKHGYQHQQESKMKLNNFIVVVHEVQKRGRERKYLTLCQEIQNEVLSIPITMN